ncbi:general substrate transporter [Lipomyces tetrasporus]|uniref:General substrate transporter n=1 Tax=Lipomyces tetrasporus TaxID=54092 RepID=A0AAD7QMH4_9ASCO|nr:general substrate transporter [Lipomyces tetrasporus]KAJ8096617.1 general substrate transporter [Lipomyces tetrasporus]
MVRFLNVYTITLFVALSGLLFGFDISSMSGIIGTVQYQNYYGNPLGVLQGAITSAMAAGSFVGSISASVLGDRVSRKVTIQVATILWCIGAILQSSSNGVAMLIAGRLIAGLCIGLTSSLVPIYQSEIAPRKIRGRVVSFQQFAITAGVLIQYIIQYGCSFLESEAAFRLPWAIQTVPAIVLFIGLFWFPYSPRWLAKRNRWEEVLQVLAFLRTPNNNINDPLVLAEYKEIEDQIHLELEEVSTSLRELYSRKLRKRVFLAIAIQIWGQLTGINVAMYYIAYLLKSAGFTDVRVASLIQYIIGMLMTIPSILWTDHFGRRPALLIGSIAMTLWLSLIGGLLMQYGEPNPISNQPYTWIVMNRPTVSRAILAFIYLDVAFFNLCWGPLIWIYPPEIVPLRVRATSVSLAVASNWAINFALALVVPPMFRSISWRMFFIFASFNFAAFIHVLIAAPETMQRTLEEMDEIFEHGAPLWKSIRYKPATNKLDLLAHDIEISMFRTQSSVPTSDYECLDRSNSRY